MIKLPKVEILHLGVMNYGTCLKLMRAHHLCIVENKNEPEKILLVEHPSVITVGNRTETHSDIITPQKNLQSLNIEVFEVERGGSATVHELGQVVMYPLLRCNVQTLGVKKLVWCIEEAMINVCYNYNVSSARDSKNPGIWVGENKIGALGLRIKDKVSLHGCALNVVNSLSTFSHIVPCGLKNKGVTSLQRETQLSESVLNTHKIQTELANKFLSFIFC
jgi:lipoate-protein ligase B